MRKTPLRRKTGISRAPLTTGRRRKPVRKRNAKRHSAEWLRAFGSVERVDWVKSLPCVVTGECGDIENVHVKTGGTGRRADYIWIVPMSRALHRPKLHQHGIRTFEQQYDIDLELAAIATQQQWLAHEARQ